MYYTWYNGHVYPIAACTVLHLLALSISIIVIHASCKNNFLSQKDSTIPIHANECTLRIKMISHQRSCTVLSKKQEWNTKYKMKNVYNDGDTMYPLDLVQTQYSMLPYPLVTNKDLLMEKRHYSTMKKSMPTVLYYTDTLENINHFFFQGKSNFR